MMKRKKTNTKEFDEVKESWALQVGIRAHGEPDQLNRKHARGQRSRF